LTVMAIKENGTILVPIDFSKQSLLAVKNSYNMARYTKSKVLLMHAFHKAEEENKAELEKLAQDAAAESGLVFETISVKGDIFEETDRMAEKLHASLIVAGLEPHVKFRSFMGNSTASKFIRNSPCPVLTVRSTSYSADCKNIIMPFDLSAESREKVATVVQVAQYYSADIRIVSVFDPHDAKYENELLPYLHQVKKYIKDRNVNCTNKSIPSKNFVETIVDYANKSDGDLIVQMNKRNVALGEMFSGTPSQRLVDISNIPVLTINPMKRESISSGIH
jgi:nucleotide-binding universal stress UspA family protein